MRRLVPMAALLLLALPAMAARRVALIAEGELAPPARHGLAKLREALRAKGFEIADSAAHADYVILAGIGPSDTLQQWKAPLPAGREALTIWRGRYLATPPNRPMNRPPRIDPGPTSTIPQPPHTSLELLTFDWPSAPPFTHQTPGLDWSSTTR